VRLTDVAQSDARFRQVVSELSLAMGEVPRKTDAQKRGLDTLAELAPTLTVDNVPAVVPKMWQAVSRLRSAHDPIKDPLRPDGPLWQLCWAKVAAPYETAVRDVVVEIAHRHVEELDRRRVLDFTGLLVRARDLLRDSEEARREAQGRFRALLVDEFQDTNRLQLELVMLLSEKRDGAPRALGEVGQIEPGFLAVVGDQKQSIYEFRGADVSVFESMAQEIEKSGGGRAYLQDSRRSSPSLAAALNAVMTAVLAPSRYPIPREDFEVAYVPEHDDLRAHRTRQAESKPIVALRTSTGGAEADAESTTESEVVTETETETETEVGDVGDDLRAEDRRRLDADAVARYLAWALDSGPVMVVPRDDAHPIRSLRGGDVAVLFQRFSNLETYRQALIRHGVRHRVVRGRGFFSAQEVIDVASMLSLIADPEDRVALAAVLRSPFVALSDSALVGVIAARVVVGSAVGFALLSGNTDNADITDEERLRLKRLQTFLAEVRNTLSQSGLRALLRHTFEVFGYRTAVAAGAFGEQALGNLEKLLERASDCESKGVSVARFAAELRVLVDSEPGEAQGEIIDESDPDTVTLCTIHQSKGLEWPVVVLPGLGSKPPVEGGNVRFDRSVGLTVAPPFGDEPAVHSARMKLVVDLQSRRRRAERLRLLYVAMTRARDQVVLGLMEDAPKKGTWSRELRECAPLFESIAVDALAPRPRRARPVDEAPDADARLGAIVARVRGRRLLAPKRIVLTVTQLEDFSRCPRRYQLAHHLGLIEEGGRLEHDALEEIASRDAGPARQRGTAVHRLLELLPFSFWMLGGSGRSDAEVVAQLELLRRLEGLSSSASDESLQWIVRFLKSPVGRRLAEAGEERLQREVPFALTVGDSGAAALVLRGQLDLLVGGEHPLVLDYKTSPPTAAGAEPFRFQLSCYALAAQKLLGRSEAVRSGIVFLHGDTEERLLPVLPEASDFAEALLRSARDLVERQASGEWPRHSIEKCVHLGCGYTSVCHRSVGDRQAG
jgi:ATP-dependent exoDNAse (exonuclease V) beta subunit